MTLADTVRSHLAIQNSRLAKLRVCAWSTTLCLALSALLSPANAQTFRTGELSGYLNLEASYGLRYRLKGQDELLVAPGRGGKGLINADDGNLNYDPGVVANIFSLKPELGVSWRNLGMFMRGYAFYDVENTDGTRDYVKLTSEAERDVANDVDLNEAYISVEFEVARIPTRLRLGKQTLNWGQSTFFQGVKEFNPVHLPQISRPGATGKDLQIGQNMLWGLMAITPLISVEGFYQLDWEPTELNSSGTYLSTIDAFEALGSYNGRAQFVFGKADDRGPTDVLGFLGLGSTETCNNMNGGAGPQTFYCDTDAFLSVPTFDPKEPDDKHGDWGFTVNAIIPQLNDAGIAFHFARYTSHVPVGMIQMPDYIGVGEPGFKDPVYGTTAPTTHTPEGIESITEELIANGLCEAEQCAGHAAQLDLHWVLRSGRLNATYPEKKIDLYGISWNAMARPTGTALGGELVYQSGLPIRVHSSQLRWGLNPTVASPECNTGTETPAGLPCAKPEFRGGTTGELALRRDTFQAMFSAVQQLPPGILGADSWSVGLEASWFHVLDMPEGPPDPLFCAKTPDNRAPASEVTALTVAGTKFGECGGAAAYVTENSWGYRMLATARWSGVFGALGVSPRLVFKDDVDGYAPNSQFMEGRKALTLGLNASFLNSASVDVAYHAFWGAGKHNFIADRDYLDLVLKYEF
jgi:hypothetical protein